MIVSVRSEYKIKRIKTGLGEFDIYNWKFYMAFDGKFPIQTAPTAKETGNLNLLTGQNDAYVLCFTFYVLWDIQVNERHK